MLMTNTKLQSISRKVGLVQLVGAELLYQRGRPPRARYLFKHALIQDAAYASLLKSTRQQVHQQIAQVFEARFPALVETQPRAAMSLSRLALLPPPKPMRNSLRRPRS